MSRQALGKGLGALLPTTDLDTVRKIQLSQIKPNPYQPRKDFDQESLNELADSIKEHGVLQPILLRKTNHGYELIAGERRFRAAQLAGLVEIPALIKDIDDQSMGQIALIENLQREDLNPIEEALAYKKLLENFEMTQEMLASAVGKNRVTITNTVRLLKLSDYVKDYVSRGTLSSGHAKALLPLLDEKTQKQVADLVIKKNWNVRQTEEYVRKLVDGEKDNSKKPTKKEDIFLKVLAEKISEHLGTKVLIKSGKAVKKIEIEFYDNDDLQRILNSIGLKE